MKTKKLKHVLAVLLTAILLVTALPFGGLTALAEDENSDWKYEIYDGEATITAYTGNAQDVVYPSAIEVNGVSYPVTQIYGGMGYNDVIKSITIPDSVQEMYALDVYGVFQDYVALEKVVLGNGLDTIPSAAFSGCTSLKEIVFGNSIEEISRYAFADCTSLTQIDFGNSLQEIDSRAFDGCTSLNNVDLPAGVKTLGDYAFNGCTALTNIALPDGIESIPCNVFDGSACYLNDSNWHNGAFYVGGYLIYADRSLSDSYIIEPGTKTVADSAFQDCVNLTEIIMPDSMQQLGNSAFSGCASLTAVQFGNNIQEIPLDCFANCSALNHVTLPSALKSIKYGAFSNCVALTDIAFPAGLQNIYDAFIGCTSLSNVVLPDNLRYISPDAFSDTPCYDDPANWTDGIFYIGKYLVDVDRAVSGTRTVRPGTEFIPNGAFYACDKLTQIVLPDSVVRIDESAFEYCGALQSVTFGNSLQEIGDYAFYGTKLQSVDLPDTVTTIAYQAFMDCTDLAEIDMPDHLVSISGQAFSNTKWYASQPDGAVYLGNMLYQYKGDCDAASIVIEPGTLGISDSAFAFCSTLSSVSLPEGLLEIGLEAFNNCTFNKIYVPQSVTHIDDHALGYYKYVEQIPDFTIYGYAGTEAERYANDNGFKFVALSKPADAETGISVVPAYADSSLPENAVLTVKTLSSSSTHVSYDISLSADGQTVQPDGAVAVKIPVPAGMDGAACKVYRAETDGTYTDMNAAYADGYLTFTTDHFSEYVVTTGDPADVPGADLLGDVDGNGMVNAADAVMVLRSDAGLVTLTAEQAAAADVTGDGIINASDAVQILRFDAGLINQF